MLDFYEQTDLFLVKGFIKSGAEAVLTCKTLFLSDAYQSLLLPDQRLWIDPFGAFVRTTNRQQSQQQQHNQKTSREETIYSKKGQKRRLLA